MFKKLFQEAPNKELYITKLTRPLSFWLVLLTFIVLIFLNSFHIVKTDSLYLEILKAVLMTMTGFYFTIRGLEKIAQYKYKNNENEISNNETLTQSNQTNVENLKEIKTINPDKLL
jgi:ABC-type nickel/cobalt efflux system permease component RcnA